MKRSTFRLVVALGVFCIAGIILIQGYWVRKAFDLKEKQFQQNIQVALGSVAEKMASISGVVLPVESPVKQLQSDYYVVNVNSTIDANLLEYYLRSEFARFNLHVDYEYQIYDCHSNNMVYGKFISADPGINAPTKKVSLPKYEDYTYYFGIRFPNRTGYVLESMDIWIFSSFILLVVIIFFGYTLTAISRQKRLSEMQKEFVNNMTHEFKTPLSTISIAANVLAKPGIENDPRSLQTYAGIIASENTRLLKQVEKVLQIASLDKDEIKINKQTVDLHQIIENVIAQSALNLDAKKAKLSLNLDAEKHKVNADELHLTNMLHNLLDNAIKYSSGTPDITISTKNIGNCLYMSVQDNGLGIQKQYQQKVFEKFFRVPTGNIHNVKGFGLGLSYVHKMVKAHKWKIELQSEENIGSTFTLSMPV
ncbi:MAG: sensor histidine kinase [Bacteroidia bacterium]